MFIGKELGYMPRIVAFGGGTGMGVLLRGLKKYTNRITAVVTVCDDGGSSGRLRANMGILPPGDIRNCLIALADTEPLMEELLQYRFKQEELEGHSFGNLLLAALTEITGDFQRAVQEANKILKVQGRVLPSTLKKVALVATHTDGTKSTGEVRVGKSDKPIHRMELRPKPVPMNPDVMDAIEQADIFVFGPGSLYTSIIPNLLVDRMVETILMSPAKKVYICNIMTQRGETKGYRASDHVAAIVNHSCEGFLDYVVVNNEPVPDEVKELYMRQGQYPVENDLSEEAFGAKVTACNLLGEESMARHNPEKLADVITRILLETLSAHPLTDTEERSER
ncbi:MAG: YvcK family protein [Planctomycetota bacterium]|nr:YvcK family protein [Planctomycetota bacterium]